MSKLDGFTQRVKVKDVLDQARRQANALEGSSFRRIEWRVADPEIAKALEEFFRHNGIREISVIYVP